MSIEENKTYDLIIIGSGPAGLSAAIYAQRAKLNTIIIEKAGMSGGQVLTTYEVDNYPALPGINGFELGTKMREHADQLGAAFKEGEVIDLKIGKGYHEVITEQDVYQTKTIIIATGAQHAKLKVPGEKELLGMGVSYCATCDGAFFRGKTVAVVGGGDVAVEDAIFLSRFCAKVYLIHRRDELRATKILQEAASQKDNIHFVWDTIVTKINGDSLVESITISNIKSQTKEELPVQGIFIAVGILPNTEMIPSIIKKDESNYLIANEDGITNIPGIFVAGDRKSVE